MTVLDFKEKFLYNGEFVTIENTEGEVLWRGVSEVIVPCPIFLRSIEKVYSEVLTGNEREVLRTDASTTLVLLVR